MQLVATIEGSFFRGQSVTVDEIEVVKQAMLQDQKGLEFKIMEDEEFEQFLDEQ